MGPRESVGDHGGCQGQGSQSWSAPRDLNGGPPPSPARARPDWGSPSTGHVAWLGLSLLCACGRWKKLWLKNK